MPENKSEKPKKLKTTKSNSGAQLFMSDEAKEKQRNRPFEGTDAEKLIRKSITNRMLEGKMIPEESGKLKANTVTDMISRSYENDKPRVSKKKYGGKVAKMKAGGMVEGYEYGGEVSGNSRGGGAALRGTKFSGCK